MKCTRNARAFENKTLRVIPWGFLFVTKCNKLFLSIPTLKKNPRTILIH